MEENIFKSGFVTVAGKPNVGKSTLINALWVKKLSLYLKNLKLQEIE